MSHWYVWIDGKYHITRTNISECQCECGKRLTSGLELKGDAPERLRCSTCEERFKPALGGPMNLPHYLEAENARLRRIENAAMHVADSRRGIKRIVVDPVVLDRLDAALENRDAD